MRAEIRACPDGPAEHEASVARLQHIGRLVPAAGLRASIRDATHTEGSGVEVSRLPCVADGEYHRIHSGNGEIIGRCRLYGCRRCHRSLLLFVAVAWP